MSHFTYARSNAEYFSDALRGDSVLKTIVEGRRLLLGVDRGSNANASASAMFDAVGTTLVDQVALASSDDPSSRVEMRAGADALLVDGNVLANNVFLTTGSDATFASNLAVAHQHVIDNLVQSLQQFVFSASVGVGMPPAPYATFRAASTYTPTPKPPSTPFEAAAADSVGPRRKRASMAAAGGGGVGGRPITLFRASLCGAMSDWP